MDFFKSIKNTLGQLLSNKNETPEAEQQPVKGSLELPAEIWSMIADYSEAPELEALSKTGIRQRHAALSELFLRTDSTSLQLQKQILAMWLTAPIESLLQDVENLIQWEFLRQDYPSPTARVDAWTLLAIYHGHNKKETEYDNAIHHLAFLTAHDKPLFYVQLAHIAARFEDNELFALLEKKVNPSTLIETMNAETNAENLARRLAPFLANEKEPKLLTRLIGRLGEDEAGVRHAATTALGELAKYLPTEPLSVLTEFLRRLGDGDFRVRAVAATTLGELAKYLPMEPLSTLTEALLRRLGDGGMGVRRAAAIALGKLAKYVPTEQLSPLQKGGGAEAVAL